MEQIETNQNKAIASFLTNIDGLIDFIIDLFKVISANGVRILSGFDLDLISIGLKQYFRLNSAQVIIQKFIIKSFPFWDKIFAIDESFFLDNAFSIFAEVPDSGTYIGSISDLFRRRKFNGRLDNIGEVLSKEELEEYLSCPKENRLAQFKSKPHRYGESHVSDEDKDEIINFFKAFIADCLKYIHYARRPFQIVEPSANQNEGGKVYTFYAAKEFHGVDIPFYQNLLVKDYPINLIHIPVSTVQYREILKSGTIRTLETPLDQNGGLSLAWAKLVPPERLSNFNISLNGTNDQLIWNGQIVERASIPPLYHQEIADILAGKRLEITKQFAIITELKK